MPSNERGRAPARMLDDAAGELARVGEKTLRTASLVVAALSSVAAVAFYFALGHTTSSPSDFAQFVGRFHPLVVHLPIGFFLLVALFEAVSLVPKARDRVDGAIGIALPVVVATAVLAFLFGLLLARGGGYPNEIALWHKRLTLLAILGMAASVAVWGWYASNGDKARRLAYRGVLGVTLGVLTIGAHFGGSLSRGEGYLGRYAPAFVQKLLGGAPPPKRAAPPAEAAAEPLVYRDVVAPVLEARCVECHGPDKSKGSLRLDDYAGIGKGGESGPVAMAGHGADSSLVARMLLPATNDDHMPPADKPQPTPEEIELIRFWIDRGANETLRVRDALAPDLARKALEAHLGQNPAPASNAPPTSSSAVPDASAQPSGNASAGVATAPPVSSGSSGNVFDDRVEPLLAARCGACHGSLKQKGKLRLDSLEATLAGGKEGPAVVAGNANGGTLFARVKLPLDAEEHMPPKKEAQLGADDIALLSWWAEHGASREAKTASLPPNLSSAPIPKATATPVATDTASALPTASASAPAIDPSTLPAEIHLYADGVKPLLAKRCGLCHEGQTPSGGMGIDDPAMMIEHGSVVPGKPTKSELLARTLLPKSDTDHMPPEEMPQPDRGELDLLQLWIQKGAGEEVVVTPHDLSPAAMASLAGYLADKSSSGSGGDAASSSSSGQGGSAPASSSNPAGSTASTGSGSTGAGPAEPPGTVHGSGCASCTMGDPEASGWVALGAAAVAVAALGIRRKKR